MLTYHCQIVASYIIIHFWAAQNNGCTYLWIVSAPKTFLQFYSEYLWILEWCSPALWLWTPCSSSSLQQLLLCEFFLPSPWFTRQWWTSKFLNSHLCKNTRERERKENLSNLFVLSRGGTIKMIMPNTRWDFFPLLSASFIEFVFGLSFFFINLFLWIWDLFQCRRSINHIALFPSILEFSFKNDKEALHEKWYEM